MITWAGGLLQGPAVHPGTATYAATPRMLTRGAPPWCTGVNARKPYVSHLSHFNASHVVLYQSPFLL